MLLTRSSYLGYSLLAGSDSMLDFDFLPKSNLELTQLYELGFGQVTSYLILYTRTWSQVCWSRLTHSSRYANVILSARKCSGDFLRLPPMMTNAQGAARCRPKDDVIIIPGLVHLPGFQCWNWEMLVIEHEQLKSTSSQHSSHSTTSPHFAHCVEVEWCWSLSIKTEINILSTKTPLNSIPTFSPR